MNVFDTITDILTNPDKYEPDEKFKQNILNADKQYSYFAIFNKNGNFRFFENDLLSLFLHSEYADLNKKELENGEMIVYGLKITSNTAYIPEIKLVGFLTKEGKYELL